MWVRRVKDVISQCYCSNSDTMMITLHDDTDQATTTIQRFLRSRTPWIIRCIIPYLACLFDMAKVSWSNFVLLPRDAQHQHFQLKGSHSDKIFEKNATGHAGQTAAPTIGRGGGGWEYMWSDEFDGPSIDKSLWGFEIGYVRNHEQQYYTGRHKNSRIDNGTLLIEAHREVCEGANNNSCNYTSASLVTKNKVSSLYGRYSLRAKIDIRLGSWPAWWWVGDSGGWPAGGEIDMMEYYNRNVLCNVMDGADRWYSAPVPLDVFGGDDFANHYHVWTWEWRPDRITLYLDGYLMNDYDVSTADGTGPNGTNPFRRPGHLIINQAIGSSGGDPGHTKFPITFRVDWMRVWKWNFSGDEAELTVQYGAGSGTYLVGTTATIAANPPLPGVIFFKWFVEAGDDVVLEDDMSSHTILRIPNGGAIVRPSYNIQPSKKSS